MIGQKIGNYEVVSQIGQGGMGAVYGAKHALLDKRVAIKVLLPQFSNNEEVVNRFFNEAKATSTIAHPGIVELYDFGHLEDGSAYIVMEHLSGEGLDTRIRRVGRMTSTEACRLIRRIAGILAAAHACGIVHRDLKPENVFLVPDPGVDEGERPKVLDFGIAKLSGEGARASTSSVQTGTGVVIGSPLYMSPEQCRGAGKVDHRADIYSLGCMLYELLSGQPPFLGEGAGEIIAAHIYLAVPDIRELQPSIDPALVDLLNRLLAKDPNARVSTMKELSDSLRRFTRKTIGGQPLAMDTGETMALSDSQSMDPMTPVPTPPPSALEETMLPEAGTSGLQRSAGFQRPFVPTTLGSTADSIQIMQPESAGKSRMPLLAFAAVALLAAGGIGYSMSSGGESRSANAPVLAPVETDTPVGNNGVEPGIEVPETNLEVTPSEVSLRIDSEPSGAEVYLKGESLVLGQTPYVHTVGKGEGAIDFVLKHKDFEESAVSMSTSADAEEKLTLVALPPATDKTKSGDAKERRAALRRKKRLAAEAAAQKAREEKKRERLRTGDGALNPFGNN